MRVIQISDTHISHLGGATSDAMAAYIELINAYEPDLVVHSGDIVILDPDNEDDRLAARTLLDKVNAPVRVIAGNHDVGEPGDHPWAGLAVSKERLTAHRSVFGDDRWLEIGDDWAIVGLNSEVLGSGLPDEEEQFDWLATQAPRIGNRQAMVFTHKPLWNPLPVELEHNISVPQQARERLLGALNGVDVRVFASGHLHQFAVAAAPAPFSSALTVSAPSTAFTHPEMGLLGAGLTQLGIVDYDLSSDRAASVRPLYRSLLSVVEATSHDVPELAAAAQGLGVTV
ncbi:metallophosphoesterase [Gordonia jinhuaensis]|uniref:Phosphohydrolase n=1 Tax=Gordonia jinhuaensis TaxID=1517702 RepID=A0A916TAA6_9ACTN|nr:metallophosphoesterase [Gordonia jinhuaensis]GGB36796.1 phosphohydrolase [Gordonia jinhuaensis]